jgi:hypothetical protein
MLGAYLPTHFNPMFLRLAMLQLYAQKVQPDVIAIYENGHEQSYLWVVEDLIQSFAELGVQVLHEHTAGTVSAPIYHERPIRMLLEAGCEVFWKVDQDDLMDINHSKVMLEALEDHDFVINNRANVIVLPKGRSKEPIVKKDFDFSCWNGVGGMANAVMFNRKFAEKLLPLLRRWIPKPDDVVMNCIMRGGTMNPKFISVKPTLTYISHGGNTSTPHWADGLLPREFKEWGLVKEENCFMDENGQMKPGYKLDNYVVKIKE